MNNTYHKDQILDGDTVAGGYFTGWRLEGRLDKHDEVVLLDESQQNLERLTSSSEEYQESIES